MCLFLPLLFFFPDGKSYGSCRGLPLPPPFFSFSPYICRAKDRKERRIGENAVLLFFPLFPSDSREENTRRTPLPLLLFPLSFLSPSRPSPCAREVASPRAPTTSPLPFFYERSNSQRVFLLSSVSSPFFSSARIATNRGSRGSRAFFSPASRIRRDRLRPLLFFFFLLVGVIRVCAKTLRPFFFSSNHTERSKRGALPFFIFEGLKVVKSGPLSSAPESRYQRTFLFPFFFFPIRGRQAEETGLLLSLLFPFSPRRLEK